MSGKDLRIAFLRAIPYGRKDRRTYTLKKYDCECLYSWVAKITHSHIGDPYKNGLECKNHA